MHVIRSAIQAMTGFMARLPEDADQRMGVVCFNSTSAELSETIADSLRDNDGALINLGTRIGDLNLATWATVRRPFF
jgi:hypothetical protein